MSWKMIFAICFIWIMGTILSNLMDGYFLHAEDVEIVGSSATYNIVEIQGVNSVLGIPKMIASTFIALGKMISWNYSFLDGSFTILKWLFLWPLSAAFIFALIQIFSSALQGIFRIF